ncbi:MAG: hypothetical protein EAZ73_27825 [Oscillatoriales cyanobacterium]|nr:MAG: hypothetical protein EAZ73_27825 [Oscillatoriales cyanobacterium]TAF31990.1 MAG: hypothetical protein EAZ69_18605 [Oscillatoriales cyanobacterium]
MLFLFDEVKWEAPANSKKALDRSRYHTRKLRQIHRETGFVPLISGFKCRIFVRKPGFPLNRQLDKGDSKNYEAHMVQRIKLPLSCGVLNLERRII